LRFDDASKTRLELPDLSDRPMAATVFAVVSNPEPGLPHNHNPRIFTASNGQESWRTTSIFGLSASVAAICGPREPTASQLPPR
jgi:hypothetical protein